MSRFYITTAIDYANGDPHLGHAYEKIGADAIARYRRLRGDDVWFLIGMDEHGQKVAQAAPRRELTPQQLVDQVAGRFEGMWARLGISHDQFIRTTAEEHKAGVRELIERIFERNPDDFYEQSYRGRYCVGCESFKQDAEIVDDRCELHPTRTLEWVEEQNWFFRLSRYRDFLLKLIEDNPGFVQPESRRNEILGLLHQGLDDISASRSRFSWGVPFPRLTSQGEQQTTYVWFDALPNYWTATRAPASRATWPAQLHVIGKDITRFHCVIWPAMLRAADLPLPRAGLGARVRVFPRRALQQERRHQAGPRRGHRPVRPRRVPLLPAARDPVGQRRQLHLGPLRRRATRPSSPTGSATWPVAPWRCWRSIGTAWCRRPSRPHWTRLAPRRFRRTRPR